MYVCISPSCMLKTPPTKSDPIISVYVNDLCCTIAGNQNIKEIEITHTLSYTHTYVMCEFIRHTYICM